jgi:hypothetical protein
MAIGGKLIILAKEAISMAWEKIYLFISVGRYFGIELSEITTTKEN